MAKQIYVVEERKDRSGIAVIILAAAFIAYWKVAVFMAIMLAIYWLVSNAFKKPVPVSRNETARKTALALRADYENMLAHRGDPVGTYGSYEPVTMPITMPLAYSEWDDGMREWQ